MLKKLTSVSVDKPKNPTKTKQEACDAVDKEPFKMDSKDYWTADRIVKRHLMKLDNIL